MGRARNPFPQHLVPPPPPWEMRLNASRHSAPPKRGRRGSPLPQEARLAQGFCPSSSFAAILPDFTSHNPGARGGPPDAGHRRLTAGGRKEKEEKKRPMN